MAALINANLVIAATGAACASNLPVAVAAILGALSALRIVAPAMLGLEIGKTLRVVALGMSVPALALGAGDALRPAALRLCLALAAAALSLGLPLAAATLSLRLPLAATALRLGLATAALLLRMAASVSAAVSARLCRSRSGDCQRRDAC